MGKTVLVTGAGFGFGALIVRALADAGHTVYAGIRDLAGRNAPAAAALATYASSRSVALSAVELDVRSQDSVDSAVASIPEPLDVVVHNAAHLAMGPVEAFTPDDIAEVMNTNVSGPQRVNRAVLPQFRERRHGLVVWIDSSSTKGGTPPYLAPYLAPYFAAKAAMDAFAVSYAAELARFDIETTIVVPGVFAQGGHAHPNRHRRLGSSRPRDRLFREHAALENGTFSSFYHQEMR
ncbi:SDR family NAD(P)-dependent oxidoreductase [Amycolatopsis sp. NPDC051372]|uniref:SDR family NAD(P)-dependent oxidoreductase n=1 Tax=Amycolatopsis sp. NPDC051372 TaxID=3155669 RepID=UPI00343F15D0